MPREAAADATPDGTTDRADVELFRSCLMPAVVAAMERMPTLMTCSHGRPIHNDESPGPAVSAA
jgi:hypothetical protein